MHISLLTELEDQMLAFLEPVINWCYKRSKLWIVDHFLVPEARQRFAGDEITGNKPPGLAS